MDIETLKIELVKKILDIDNEKFIQKVKEFIIKEQTEFWNELSTEQQAEIKKGIDQLDNGKRTPYKEFLKKIS